jgi:hypothetical protein
MAAITRQVGKHGRCRVNGRNDCLRHGLVYRLLACLIAGGWFLCRAVLILWATLAIYYSNLPWPGVRLTSAISFAAFAVWAVWFAPGRRMSVALIALYLGVIGWWMSISPSNDRQWRPEVAVMPRAFIDGDRVRLTGVRNFDTGLGMTSRCGMRSVSCRCRT